VPATRVHREQSGCGDRPASHLTAAAAALAVVVAAAIGGEEAEGDGGLETQIG